MFRMVTRKGFTLIELLVVIAIIGILSAVVLVSLNSARTKGADASIKSNLTSTRSQAALFYDSNNASYSTVCLNTTVGGVKSIYGQVLAAAKAGGHSSFNRNATGAINAVCNDSADAWAAQVPLKATAGTWFCVDSEGVALVATTNRLISGTDYVCSS